MQTGAASCEAPGAGTPAVSGGNSSARTPVVVPVPPAEVTPSPHAQSQGGQLGPKQLGHAQVQVPPLPVPPPQVPPPLPQSHVHGAQAAPGGQSGQLQAQVPPPPPPPGGGAQSHCTAGQSAFAGQASGRRQAQPPPEASRRWQ